MFLQEFIALEEALDAYVIVCWLTTSVAADFEDFKRILTTQPGLLQPRGFNIEYFNMASHQRITVLSSLPGNGKWSPTSVRKTFSEISGSFSTLFRLFGVKPEVAVPATSEYHERLLYCIRIWLSFLASGRFTVVHR
jgi:hypothetical protein